MSEENKSKLAKYEGEVAKARTEYEGAKANASMARSAETSALNKLNEVQKKFDAAVQEIKASHKGTGSDWERESRQQ